MRTWLLFLSLRRWTSLAQHTPPSLTTQTAELLVRETASLRDHLRQLFPMEWGLDCSSCLCVDEPRLPNTPHPLTTQTVSRTSDERDLPPETTFLFRQLFPMEWGRDWSSCLCVDEPRLPNTLLLHWPSSGFVQDFYFRLPRLSPNLKTSFADQVTAP